MICAYLIHSAQFTQVEASNFFYLKFIIHAIANNLINIKVYSTNKLIEQETSQISSSISVQYSK